MKYAIIPSCYLPFPETIMSQIDTESEKNGSIIVDDYEIRCFKIVCGAGLFKIMLNDEHIGYLDSDYGVIVVVPYFMLDEFALFALPHVGIVFEAEQIKVEISILGDILVNDYFIRISDPANISYQMWYQDKDGYVSRIMTTYLTLAIEFNQNK